MTVNTVGIVGLGLLGRGITACLVGNGIRVIADALTESDQRKADAAIDQAIGELVHLGGPPVELRKTWRDRFDVVHDDASFGKCDFIIESVTEDVSVKQSVFDRLEAVVMPDTPIATNTSAIPISKLQQGRKHPERFLGMHWAEPAHATRFMELIRGETTGEAAFQRAVDLARRVGKEPCVVRKDSPGFLVNRIGYAMYLEALSLVEEGVADIETIDTACRNAFGLWATVCGPFRWIDITGGPALYARAMRGMLEALGRSTALPETIQTLEQAGAEGTRNHRGFYDYTSTEAHRWEELYREHAWHVRELMNKYFPLQHTPEKGSSS